MEDTKAWYASKTVWASIAQLMVGIAMSLGLFTPDQGAAVIVQFPDVAVGIATSTLAVISFITRLLATKQLTVKSV